MLNKLTQLGQAAKALVTNRRVAVFAAFAFMAVFSSMNAVAAAAIPVEISDLTGSAELVWDSITPIIAGVVLFLIAIRFVKKIR